MSLFRFNAKKNVVAKEAGERVASKGKLVLNRRKANSRKYFPTIVYLYRKDDGRFAVCAEIFNATGGIAIR